jgi:plastocyanin
MHTRNARILTGLLLLPVAAGAWAADHVVTVGGTTGGGEYEYPVMSFSPQQLTIAVGDTVTFVNAGGVHNVYADDGSFRCAQGCDSQGGNGAPSGNPWTTTVAFNAPGTIGYSCQAHAGMGMRGTITVQGGGPAEFNLDQHGLSGSWADATTDSQGLVMELFPDIYGEGLGLLFGGWFTFDVTAAGGQRWYTIQGTVTNDDDTATMPIYLTQGGALDSPQATTTSEIGEATLHFDSCNAGSLQYAFDDGRSGTIPLARLLANVSCTPTGDSGIAGRHKLAGAWADAGNSGQGLVLDVNPPQDIFFAAWYTFLGDAAGNAGPPGQHWYTLQAALTPGFTQLLDIGIFDSSGGVFDQGADTATAQVGTADLVFHSCASATLSYAFTGGVDAGTSGELALTRIGPVPEGCAL